MPDEPAPRPNEKSFGNMSERHWSRARRDANPEAREYYQERSRAPGVKEGGGSRNHYCMHCDGVIPLDAEHATCPHCGVALEGQSKRYFNWVEINEPPKSDARALLWVAVPALLAVFGLAWLVWRFVL